MERLLNAVYQEAKKHPDYAAIAAEMETWKDRPKGNPPQFLTDQEVWTRWLVLYYDEMVKLREKLEAEGLTETVKGLDRAYHRQGYSLKNHPELKAKYDLIFIGAPR
jgi:hypothetical protein